MEFEDYEEKINSIGEIETFGQLSKQNIKKSGLRLKVMKWSSRTSKFKSAQIKDKRYYFSDGIVSLPFSHPYLKEIVDFKREKKTKNRDVFTTAKTQTYSAGKICSQKNKRVLIYRSILQ